MKLAALDKSTCAMSANNNHRAQSGYNYVGKMLKNKEDESAANIPLEAVTEVRGRKNARQTQEKYIQCILPFLCILQVISVVSVSVCLYLYSVTLDDYNRVQKDVFLLRHKYEEVLKLRNEIETNITAQIRDVLKLRNEIETNITDQIRDVQQIARNLTQAKSQINDYDENDYDQYETDYEDKSTASPPNISEEPDNQPPTGKLRDEQRRKAHLSLVADDDDEQNVSIPNTTTRSSEEVHMTTSLNSTKLELSRPSEEFKDDEKSKRKERNTRSIHFDKKLFEDINPDKNDAEGDYLEVPLVQAKASRPRYHPFGQIDESVDVSEKNKKKKPSLESKFNVNHTDVLHTRNETQDSKQLDSARSLKLMEEALVELKMSWGQSHKEEPKDNSQYNMPSPAIPNRIAIHLVGDTSKYKVNKEKHYDVNHRMYHPKGHIKDWKIDSSVSGQEHTDEESFKLENGHLKVKELGLYFVYAQIYYSSKEDTSGFNVFLNDNVMMRCITTGVTSEQLEAVHATAPNSCYTARLMHISPGDTLSIKETQGERFTIFESTRSFFGLFKVG